MTTQFSDIIKDAALNCVVAFDDDASLVEEFEVTLIAELTTAGIITAADRVVSYEHGNPDQVTIRFAAREPLVIPVEWSRWD